MRTSPNPTNLTYIAFRGKKHRHGCIYKEFALWPLKKSSKSFGSASIIAGLQPSEALAQDMSVLVGGALRDDGT